MLLVNRLWRLVSMASTTGRTNSEHRLKVSQDSQQQSSEKKRCWKGRSAVGREISHGKKRCWKADFSWEEALLKRRFLMGRSAIGREISHGKKRYWTEGFSWEEALLEAPREGVPRKTRYGKKCPCGRDPMKACHHRKKHHGKRVCWADEANENSDG